ncbi:MAG: M28 family peptidase, partial [Sciscionella sp.]
VLLSAHLCHPRPGANDNASGVAALLGIARVLTMKNGPCAKRGPGVRFLWGPEFTGIAAYLHDVVMAGAAPRPVLAVNVDMAGQNVARCGGPLVIERGPDDIPSFLPALAERCAGLLPAQRSYSGAVPCDPWTWRASPFAGGSDHALLADDPIRSAVIALGHWPDRANHSSADTPELVDPAELRRTAAIACATVAAIRGRADPELSGDVADATLSWAAAHLLAVLPGQRPGGTAASTDPGTIDPLANGSAWRLLRHRTEVSRGAIGSVSCAGAGQPWVRSAQAWVTSVADMVADRILPTVPRRSQDTAAADGTALERHWNGPVNLRALAAAARPEDRGWLADQLAADRGGNYARSTALMRAVNGRRDWYEATWWAALSSELPITREFASRFLGLLGGTGWTSRGGCA